MRRASILIPLIILLLGTPNLQAEESPNERDQAKAFLLTMGQGDEVWEKFGHNALWIHDPIRGTDWVYNYGVFDFNSPGYWSRFVRGNWIYQLAVSDINRTILEYRYRDRTVIAQELDLDPGQLNELREFLEWNARPENAEYLYDYYRDNCSTRIRDLIDQVTDGALSRATADVPSGTTFRWHSYRLVQGDLATYTGLALGLGPSADRPISRWEEMFLPGVLQDEIRSLEIPGPDGQSRPLVRAEHLIHEASNRTAELEAPISMTGRYLAGGVGLGALLLVLGWLAGEGGQALRGSSSTRSLRNQISATRFMGRLGLSIIGGLWALLSGGGGLLLSILWGLTNHSIAHRNLNLLQASPLAFSLVLLLPALAIGARWATRPTTWVTTILLISSTIGLLLHLLPGVAQANGSIIAFALPANLGLYLGVRELRRYRSSPPAGTAADSPVYHRSTSANR